jgi:hypothetical protein
VSSTEPGTLAAYATELARAFGVDVAISEPQNERQKAALLARLRATLHDVRPVATAASIGEVLDALLASVRPDRAAKPPRHVRRQLAELDDLVAAATYARTKRAERGRIFALLLVVFDLTSLTGIDAASADAEALLKLVRRARR